MTTQTAVQTAPVPPSQWQLFAATFFRNKGAVLVQNALHQHLQLAAAGLLAKHAGRNDPGIIKNQGIPWFKIIRHVIKMAMRNVSCLPVKHKQP